VAIESKSVTGNQTWNHTIMNGEFKVYVGVTPNMLRNHYTTRHQLVFGGLSLQVGDESLPTGDFLGGEFLLVLLLYWNKAIHRLAGGKSRAAKLFFTISEGEIWVRKTATSLWRVSYIDYLRPHNRIRAEVLCIPERLEAGLLSVSRKVLLAAREAGIWTPDCADMERFLSEPEEYIRECETNSADNNNRGKYADRSPSVPAARPPRFFSQRFGRDPQISSLFSELLASTRSSPPPAIYGPVERRPPGTPRPFCPRCLIAWIPSEDTRIHFTCPLCRYEICGE
jgi:hypothetical protein